MWSCPATPSPVMTGDRRDKAVDKLKEPLELRENGKVPFLTVAAWEPEGAQAVFSTRMGGVSKGEYAWMNMGFSTRDNPEFVRENRRAFWSATGVAPGSVAQAWQVHGDRVAVCYTAGNYRETDGLVTARSGVVLVGTFADCVPIYLFDPVARVVALAHAGWRGTLSAIAARAVEAMVTCGAKASQCMAVIGPAIGACCYLVDERVMTPFAEAFPTWTDLTRPDGGGGFFLDLKGINLRHLVNAGLSPSRVRVSGWCTACHPLVFFSHRRDSGRTGRMVGALWLTGVQEDSCRRLEKSERTEGRAPDAEGQKHTPGDQAPGR